MKFNSTINLNLEDCETYFKLLQEEDFNFKTKNILININKNSNSDLSLEVSGDNILDLKIGMNAIIKSLEVIDKTLNI